MKKKNIALGIGGAVGGAITWKMLTRAGEVNWADVSDKVFTRKIRISRKLTARRFIIRNSGRRAIRR